MIDLTRYRCSAQGCKNNHRRLYPTCLTHAPVFMREPAEQRLPKLEPLPGIEHYATARPGAGW